MSLTLIGDVLDRRKVWDEAARLIALSVDLLTGEQDEIVRDYLTHALAALTRLRESPSGEQP